MKYNIKKLFIKEYAEIVITHQDETLGLDDEEFLTFVEKSGYKLVNYYSVYISYLQSWEVHHVLERKINV